MKKVLYILYQPYKWLVWFPLFLTATIITCVVAIILAAIVNPRFAGLAPVCWARFICFITPVSVTVKGKENLDKSQSYVFVSNHMSHFDVLVIYGRLGADIRWVMKQELRKIPVFGYASEKVGHIFVDRSNSAAARASLEKAKRHIVNGTSVFFFPEGTRSLDGKPGEFKKGAFIMALELGLPIIPITINGTNNILPPTSLKLFPGRAEMTVHKPVNTSGYSRENMDELISKAKDIIRSGLWEETCAQ